MEHGSSKSGRQEVTADIRTCGTQQGKWFLRIVSLSECTASRSVFRMSTQWGSPVLQLNNILCHSTQQNQTFFFFKTWHTGFMAPSCGESEHYMSCERAAYADALKTELLLWAWKEPHHSPGSTIQVSNNSVWGRCGRLSLESAALKAISILFELPEICGLPQSFLDRSVKVTKRLEASYKNTAVIPSSAESRAGAHIGMQRSRRSSSSPFSNRTFAKTPEPTSVGGGV